MNMESRSPQQPSDKVYACSATSGEAVAEWMATARRAQREWVALPPLSRVAALHAAGEAVAAASTELVDLVVREVGKPLAEARGEVARGVAILHYYAQQVLDPDGSSYPASAGRGWLFARRRPHGVAGLITPWNFPVAIPLWKLCPALAYGNAAILKPAEQSPGVAMRLHELIAPQLPDGLFTVLPGEGETGAALIEHVDCVSFTGSAKVGSSVRLSAAARGIPAQCEMGGQNPSVVLTDVDVERAAQTIAEAAMGYAGQKCTATSRVIIVGDAREFTDAFSEAVRGLAVGDPAELGVVVGPLIEESARQAVLGAVEELKREGGRVVTGGRPIDRDGWYIEPTVFDGLPPQARLNQQEIFGPICGLLSAASAEQALQIANGVDYGLVGAVFTRDLDQALDVAERLEVGLARINAPTSGVDFYAPFGGWKSSSYGPREQGKAAREFYTFTQTVTVAPNGV